MFELHPVELLLELRRSEWYADEVDVVATVPSTDDVDGSVPERVVVVDADGDDVPDVQI